MTSEAHLRWVLSVVVYGTVLRVHETRLGLVLQFIFFGSEQLQLTWILQGERFVGAISTIKARAPVTGGNFGVWGGMFSTFDCAVKGWRQKEDAWNAIISGFMTGGCLAARSKPTSDF